MDLVRQQRVLANVELIEAREQQERAQLRRLNAAPSTPVANDSILGANSPSVDEPPADEQSQTSSRWEESQIPPSSGSHAPQSWAPRTRRRDSQS
jgi:NADH dehydrogenase [ubiquinone] 1 alpha subcomplex assembly factor 2